MLQIGRRRRPFTYSQLRSIDKRSKQTRWTQLLLLFSALSIYSRLFGLFPFISARENFFGLSLGFQFVYVIGRDSVVATEWKPWTKKKYRTKLGSAARKKKTYQASPTGELSGSATTQRIRPTKKKRKGIPKSKVFLQVNTEITRNDKVRWTSNNALLYIVFCRRS